MTSDQLLTKLDILKSNLDKLDRIPQASFDEFIADFRNVDSTLHILQTSIQALIDVAAYQAARRALPTPKTSHEIFERLEQAGHLPSGTAARFAPIVGFRNRVVHLYDRIDERRVFESLTQHRRDIAVLLDLLLAIDPVEA
jgi:uncharacterized protein YutE (UPF0331/DUF86 family)